MPLLPRESDLYPDSLLEWARSGESTDHEWSVVYTMSRREKQLARELKSLSIGFYLPTYEARHRSPSGRVRSSYLPLFPGYVFLFTPSQNRDRVLSTNCVSRWIDVAQPEQLANDLTQLRHVLAVGKSVLPESRLEPGTRARVTGGPLAGLEGTILRRQGQTRLCLAVNFLQQGASVEIDEIDLVPV